MAKTNWKSIKTYSEYCTGCGLCASVSDVSFSTDEKGFLYPNLKEKHIDLCKIVCPSSGYAMKECSNGKILGNILETKLGWSTDDDIRYKSSSGGVITSLCVFLIKEKIVDGIIQVRKSAIDVRKTETIVSTTAEDVLSCMGSRYTSSSPLANITKMIEPNKVYAFVGKPCDVSALRMYKKCTNDEWVKQILFMFSFFCAGQPSESANDKLLQSLHCTDFHDCADLQYRGHGWPGYTTVKLKNGKEYKLDYETSWMKILGRDVRRFCRFCADGTGEQADISCGDAWYLTRYLKPDLTEHQGRNVILVRTQEGINLLNKAVRLGVVHTENYSIEKDGLRYSQPYHYTRKASLSSLKLAMLICGRNFPYYDNKNLRNYAKELSLKEKFLRFLGTIQRILKHKL